jgi:hypothetical protein
MTDKRIVKQKSTDELLLAINQPNPGEADKKAFRELLKEQPGIWQATTDLAAKLEEKIYGEICSNSYGAKEAFRKRLAAMRDNLDWKNSSEMEKILIEQVCLNWLRLNILEDLHHIKTTGSHSSEHGIYWDKRLNSAQRRYLRACESLAKVRKLLAEAELKEQQARNKRSKSTAIATKLLKELTN